MTLGTRIELDSNIIPGGDGSTVSSGKKSGVLIIMKEEIPWIAFVWCMTHRLKFAIQDALKEMVFEEVEDMILRIFYLYQKTQKNQGIKSEWKIISDNKVSTLACQRRYFEVN